jgi:hypothetical protein
MVGLVRLLRIVVCFGVAYAAFVSISFVFSFILVFLLVAAAMAMSMFVVAADLFCSFWVYLALFVAAFGYIALAFYWVVLPPFPFPC